jgi:penicillin-binding protein 2
MNHRIGRVTAAGLAAALLLTALPAPQAGVSRAGEPAASDTQALAAVERYVVRWRTESYERMHELLHAADRARYTSAGFVRQHEALSAAIGLTSLTAEIGPVRAAAHAPEPRPPSLAAPSGPSGVPARGVVDGPVPALEVDLNVTLQTTSFGELVLRRSMRLTPDVGGWRLRWTPELLFPALGTTGGTFRLEEGPLPTRGRILAADGSVLAMTRPDGKRVYPLESLAGQTVGYATALSAEEAAEEAAARPTEARYQAGQVAGRSGIEAGAEALLRGRTARALVAEPYGGAPIRVLDRRAVAGADVRLTIQPDIQRSAERALVGRPEAATAVVDPRSGDVWALASAPAFNPNAMTIGTTYAGAAIATPTAHQIRNHALESAYPTGSSFKPFALAAALKVDAASPATRMSCLPTWTFGGVRFVNFELHQLPGLVSLVQAMAFSCNTTYMPLSIRIWERDRNALAATVAEFGYGQPTGIGWVAETGGVLPDRLWYETHRRASGRYVSFNTFDQIQLSIGQGELRGTQLQQALAYAAFANRGTLWKPRLVISATTPDGAVLLATEPEVRRRIAMDAADLEYVVTALQSVTTFSYGTATAAFAGFGIPVAGKSGTAETGGPDPHALFPAFAPTANPEIVVASILARIRLGTGGSSTAPLVRQVMAAYFNR